MSDSVTPRTVAHQESSVHGIPQARIWIELPFPSLGYLPDPGIEPGSPALQGDSLLSEPPGKLSYLDEHSSKCYEFSKKFSFLFIQQVFIEGQMCFLGKFLGIRDIRSNNNTRNF